MNNSLKRSVIMLVVVGLFGLGVVIVWSITQKNNGNIKISEFKQTVGMTGENRTDDTNSAAQSTVTVQQVIPGRKSYSSDIVSFNYPPIVTLEERQKDYLVLLLDEKNPQSVLVSIDARKQGDYLTYEGAVKGAEDNLVEVIKKDLGDGVKLSGKIGPGMGQGLPVTRVILKAVNGAVGIETTTNNSDQLAVFDEIVASVILGE